MLQSNFCLSILSYYRKKYVKTLLDIKQIFQAIDPSCLIIKLILFISLNFCDKASLYFVNPSPDQLIILGRLDNWELAKDSHLMKLFVFYPFFYLFQVYSNSAGPGVRHNCIQALLRMIQHTPTSVLKSGCIHVPLVSSQIAGKIKTPLFYQILHCVCQKVTSYSNLQLNNLFAFLILPFRNGSEHKGLNFLSEANFQQTNFVCQ